MSYNELLYSVLSQLQQNLPIKFKLSLCVTCYVQQINSPIVEKQQQQSSLSPFEGSQLRSHLICITCVCVCMCVCECVCVCVCVQAGYRPGGLSAPQPMPRFLHSSSPPILINNVLIFFKDHIPPSSVHMIRVIFLKDINPKSSFSFTQNLLSNIPPGIRRKTNQIMLEKI